MFDDKQKSYVSTYTLQGKNWMNNTHIGPSNKEFYFIHHLVGVGLKHFVVLRIYVSVSDSDLNINTDINTNPLNPIKDDHV